MIKKRAFTLMEVIMAMGVFMLGMAPLLAVLTATTKVHSDNMFKIKANMLASERLNEVQINAKVDTNFWTATLPTPSVTSSTKYPALQYLEKYEEELYGLVRYELGITTKGQTLVSGNSIYDNNVMQAYVLWIAKEL